MVKLLLVFTFMFLMLSSVSFAAYDDTKLKQEYGQDLTKAPFYLRYEYGKESGKDWGQTTFSEREYFLKNHEDSVAKEQAKERDEAKTAAREERDRLYQERAQARQERDNEREDAEEEKAENEEDAQRQKDFDQSLRDQQQVLQQLRQEADQRQ